MKLIAGRLSMEYEHGFVRYIRSGNTELVRMIYFALRDRNWGTIPGRIDDEQMEQLKDGFRVAYRCSSREGPIAMDWQVSIVGTPNDRILFEVQGLALSGFYINRAGICVLHPVAECRGKSCLIGHPDGKAEIKPFPDTISPQQIFRDIRTMQWEAAPGLDIRLDFSGDVFETEDHRNWTDHSFKTYSTPLDRPYPIFLPRGAIVHQSLSVVCTMPPLMKGHGKRFAVSIPESDEFSLSVPWPVLYFDQERRPLPSVGICRPGNRQNGWLATLPYLKTVGFSHYRVELTLSSQDCRQNWQNAREEANMLDLPVELVLYFSADFRQEMEILKVISGATRIKHILVLESTGQCTGNKLIAQTLPLIRSLFPGVPVGSGTDAHFAELNRSNIDPRPLDFINFSITPQVHAEDDLTLIENLEAQAETLISAARKFPGKPIHVSPVTLRQRHYSMAADPRQSSAFIAGWTLGSLKYLAENGVASITYYEAAGEKGLVAYTREGELSPYPLMQIFEQLLNKGWEAIQLSRSDRPLMVSSLVLCRGSEKKILLVNHTTADINVVLSEKNNPLGGTGAKRPERGLAVKLQAMEIRTISFIPERPMP